MQNPEKLFRQCDHDPIMRALRRGFLGFCPGHPRPNHSWRSRPRHCRELDPAYTIAVVLIAHIKIKCEYDQVNIKTKSLSGAIRLDPAYSSTNYQIKCKYDKSISRPSLYCGLFSFRPCLEAFFLSTQLGFEYPFCP